MKITANAMPAPTWHRLSMNDTVVELPELPAVAAADLVVEGAAEATEDAFDAALEALQAELDAAAEGKPEDERLMIAAARGEASLDNLDIPALSSYELGAVEAEVANDVADAFATGAGEEAAEYLQELAREAGAVQVVATQAGQAAQATLHVDGVDGAAAVAALDVVAAPGSTLDVRIAFDSPVAGAGFVGAVVRGYVGKGATVNITSVQSLDDTWTAINDLGLVLNAGARVNVAHTVVGGGVSITGLAADLRGDESRIDVDTRYLGARAQKLDFNYIIRHRGKKTQCNLDANGVLAGESNKTLRGTIDLIHGAKGAEGNERETVLLADERVENKTIPVILCDEDDVAGNHGATIGHVRPDQLTYLMSRGFSQDAAEALFLSSTLQWAHLNAFDARVAAGVARVAAQLGVAVAEEEE